MKKSTFFHVGDLDLASLVKPKKSSFSYEGNGLSISRDPEAWIRIARLGGRKIYSLTKENPSLLKVSKKVREEAIFWAKENGYIKPAKKFSAPYYDEDGTKIGSFYFNSFKEALQENDNPKKIKEVDSHVFDTKGIKYWESHFTASLSEDMAEDFAVIFFAEAQGYEGVWWNEQLDVENLSAPRGVIFQQYLTSWNFKELSKYS